MKKIEISHKTIIFTVAFLLFVGFLYYVRDIILVFFVSLLIMTILNPTVTKLSQKKIPRGLSVIVVYILAIVFLSVSIGSVVPPLVEQTTKLVNNFPSYSEGLGLSSIVNEQISKEFFSQFGTLPGYVFKFSISVFSNLIGVITVLILAFYLLMARNKIDGQIEDIFNSSKAKSVIKVLNELEKKLGGWARGQLFLMIVVGITVFIGLTLLGIPYALPLSLLAAIFEVIPNFGPFLAALPAVAIGFGTSPFLGLAIVALYTLIQQIENYVFVPKIIEKSTGVPPVVTLLALAIGFKVAGIVGAIISVPVYITTQVILKAYVERK